MNEEYDELITKEDLVKLLKSFNVPATEGVPEDNDIEAETRICFWEYVWDDIVASCEVYKTKVTYQVSVISEYPRCKELLKLKKKLNELNQFPMIQHEKDIQTRRWHSYFSIDVLEEIEVEEDNEEHL